MRETGGERVDVGRTSSLCLSSAAGTSFASPRRLGRAARAPAAVGRPARGRVAFSSRLKRPPAFPLSLSCATLPPCHPIAHPHAKHLPAGHVASGDRAQALAGRPRSAQEGRAPRPVQGASSRPAFSPPEPPVPSLPPLGCVRPLSWLVRRQVVGTSTASLTSSALSDSRLPLSRFRWPVS
jgi:hypothetical protein